MAGLVFRYAKKLEFFETPDYNHAKRMFSDCLAQKGFVNDGEFDWSQKLRRKL